MSAFELRVEPGRVIARVTRRGGGDSWHAEAPWSDPGTLGEAVSLLATAARRAGAGSGVMVRMAADAHQSRYLADLPPVSARTLERLVARGAARYFRQNGHSLVTAARWETAGTPPVRRVRAAAIDSVLAEALVDGVACCGMVVTDIVTVTPDGGGLSLLPAGERRRRARAMWRRAAWLALVIGASWSTVALAAWMRLGVARREVNSELARLAGPRKALLGAREALDSATAMVHVLEAGEAARTLVGARVALLARSLPDSTVLTSLETDTAGRLAIAGRAAHALTVYRVLARVPALGHLRLQPETARDTALGLEWERFGFSVGSEPAP